MSEPAHPRRKRLRLPALDYASPPPYFVTVCTLGRRPLFLESAAGEVMLRCVMEGAQDTGFSILAACIMPDHWHALVMPRTGAHDLGDMVRATKGKAIARLRGSGTGGRIWQSRFHDHVVRAEEDLRQVAEYIANNPVRKGLVVRAEDYPLYRIFPDAFPV